MQLYSYIQPGYQKQYLPITSILYFCGYLEMKYCPAQVISFYMASCHTPTCLEMHLCTCKRINYNDSLARQMRIAQRCFHRFWSGRGVGLSLKNMFHLGFRLLDLAQTLQHDFQNTFSRKNTKFRGVDYPVIKSAGLDTSGPPPPSPIGDTPGIAHHVRKEDLHSISEFQWTT